MRAILTYHSIDDSGSVISLPEAAFARHVEWLASGRVRVTTVDDLLRLPDAVDAVAITFDDGFRNFGEVAAPRLAAHGLSSTVFVVSDHVGRTNAWGGVLDARIPELPLLSWGELEQLAQGGVTIGGHTRRHGSLSRVGGQALVDEIVGGARAIEDRIGCAPPGFAYPYGAVTDDAAALVAATFSWGCTTELRRVAAREDHARLPRLDMYYFREPGSLEPWGTARFDYYVKLRAGIRHVRQGLALRRESR
jgi:peptidoglycan/xylan/chitin deacetylase (PgdA/CDA1 family)